MNAIDDRRVQLIVFDAIDEQLIRLGWDRSHPRVQEYLRKTGAIAFHRVTDALAETLLKRLKEQPDPSPQELRERWEETLTRMKPNRDELASWFVPITPQVEQKTEIRKILERCKQLGGKNAIQ